VNDGDQLQAALRVQNPSRWQKGAACQLYRLVRLGLPRPAGWIPSFLTSWGGGIDRPDAVAHLASEGPQTRLCRVGGRMVTTGPPSASRQGEHRARAGTRHPRYRLPQARRSTARRTARPQQGRQGRSALCRVGGRGKDRPTIRVPGVALHAGPACANTRNQPPGQSPRDRQTDTPRAFGDISDPPRRTGDYADRPAA
jgi:hypothetical protein